MKYKFEMVIDGIARWIDAEIYPGMNDIQELVARMFVGRVIENEASIKKYLESNGIIRTFGVIDNEGMVDVDSLVADLKREIGRKGKITVSIPMFGKMTFNPDDADKLYEYIVERK